MDKNEKSLGYLFWDYVQGGIYIVKSTKFFWGSISLKFSGVSSFYVILRIRILTIELVANVSVKRELYSK